MNYEVYLCGNCCIRPGTELSCLGLLSAGSVAPDSDTLKGNFREEGQSKLGGTQTHGSENTTLSKLGVFRTCRVRVEEPRSPELCLSKTP